jgi:hypothetical protein
VVMGFCAHGSLLAALQASVPASGRCEKCARVCSDRHRYQWINVC